MDDGRSPHESTIALVVRSPKGESRGAATLQAIPRENAVRKGLVVWLGSWGLALATLPIPIVHFVAPPLLLVLGPVVGLVIYKIYNGAVDLTRGEAVCPDCGTSVGLGPCAERWPLDVVCPGCEARLSVVRG